MAGDLTALVVRAGAVVDAEGAVSIEVYGRDSIGWGCGWGYGRVSSSGSKGTPGQAAARSLRTRCALRPA